MMFVNPLNQLYKDLLMIIQQSTIKYKSEADKYENLNIRKKSDEYLTCVKNEDSFDSYYTYDIDVILTALISRLSNDLKYATSLNDLENIENIKYYIKKPLSDNTYSNIIKVNETKNGIYINDDDELISILENPNDINIAKAEISPSPSYSRAIEGVDDDIYPFYVKSGYIYPFKPIIDRIKNIGSDLNDISKVLNNVSPRPLIHCNNISSFNINEVGEVSICKQDENLSNVLKEFAEEGGIQFTNNTIKYPYYNSTTDKIEFIDTATFQTIGTVGYRVIDGTVEIGSVGETLPESVDNIYDAFIAISNIKVSPDNDFYKNGFEANKGDIIVAISKSPLLWYKISSNIYISNDNFSNLSKTNDILSGTAYKVKSEFTLYARDSFDNIDHSLYEGDLLVFIGNNDNNKWMVINNENNTGYNKNDIFTNLRINIPNFKFNDKERFSIRFIRQNEDSPVINNSDNTFLIINDQLNKEIFYDGHKISANFLNSEIVYVMEYDLTNNRFNIINMIDDKLFTYDEIKNTYLFFDTEKEILDIFNKLINLLDNNVEIDYGQIDDITKNGEPYNFKITNSIVDLFNKIKLDQSLGYFETTEESFRNQLKIDIISFKLKLKSFEEVLNKLVEVKSTIIDNDIIERLKYLITSLENDYVTTIDKSYNMDVDNVINTIRYNLYLIFYKVCIALSNYNNNYSYIKTSIREEAVEYVYYYEIYEPLKEQIYVNQETYTNGVKRITTDNMTSKYLKNHMDFYEYYDYIYDLLIMNILSLVDDNYFDEDFVDRVKFTYNYYRDRYLNALGLLHISFNKIYDSIYDYVKTSIISIYNKYQLEPNDSDQIIKNKKNKFYDELRLKLLEELKTSYNSSFYFMIQRIMLFINNTNYSEFDYNMKNNTSYIDNELSNIFNNSDNKDRMYNNVTDSAFKVYDDLYKVISNILSNFIPVYNGLPNDSANSKLLLDYTIDYITENKDTLYDQILSILDDSNNIIFNELFNISRNVDSIIEKDNNIRDELYDDIYEDIDEAYDNINPDGDWTKDNIKQSLMDWIDQSRSTLVDYYNFYNDIKLSYKDISDSIIKKARLYSSDKNNIPDDEIELKKELFTIKHNRIKNNYIEYNNYYRMITGLPNILYDVDGNPLYVETNEDGTIKRDSQTNNIIYIKYSSLSETDFNAKHPGTDILIYKVAVDEDYVFYVDDETARKYGINSLPTPIHELSLEEISILNSISHPDDPDITYLQKLYNDNKYARYLLYLGDKAVDLVLARLSKNFALLKLPYGINENTWNSFASTYEQCREYFMSIIYISEYKSIIEYYDNFIAMCIMIMTIQQIFARVIKSDIERDFYDDYSIRILFNAYGIPYNDKMSDGMRKTLLQNLNLLVQNKGSNKVIFDILSIIGFDKATVNKYYLVKTRKLFDKSGNIIPTPDKTIDDMIDEGNNIEDIHNEFSKSHDIHFQEVNILEENLYSALIDDDNRVEYEELTTGDPYWVEDSNLLKELYESEYNFVETKYMGLTISYSITEIIFENIYFLKMLLDNKDTLQNITITLPKLESNATMSLFQAVIALCAMICKQNHLAGNVVLDYTKTLHVMGFNFFDSLDSIIKPYIEEEMNVIGYETNTDGLMSSDEKAVCSENNKNHADKSFFTTYEIERPLQDKTITVSDIKFNPESLELWKDYNYLVNNDPLYNSMRNKDITNLLIRLYTTLYNGTGEDEDHYGSFYKFLVKTMEVTNNIEVYDACKKLYKAIFYTKENREIFAMGEKDGEIEYPNTFLEYLQKMNPAVYNIIVRTDPDDLYELIDHITSKMIEVYFSDMSYLGFYAKSSGTMETMLLELIRFFKSYTVDMLNLKTIFVFDFKTELFLKFIDQLRIDKNLWTNDNLRLAYSDIINEIHKEFDENEKIKLLDKLYLFINMVVDGHYEGDTEEDFIKNKLYLYERDTLINNELSTKENIGLFDVYSLDASDDHNDKISFNDKVIISYDEE